MGYFKKTTQAGNTLIVEKGYSYFQGMKHFRGGRAPKLNPTSEKMRKVNERRAIWRLTAQMNENFQKGDLHLVLTYRAENRPDAATARLYLIKFIRKLRALYRKYGLELKYIHATEYKNKAIHHHILVNYMDVKKIQSLWEHGAVRPTVVYSDNLQRLAEYFVKETRKTFGDADAPYRQRYVPSRNLVQPETKREDIGAESWLMEPRVPQGYYLDRDSLVNGISEDSGYPYQRYVLIRLVPTGHVQRKRRFPAAISTLKYTAESIGSIPR